MRRGLCLALGSGLTLASLLVVLKVGGYGVSWGTCFVPVPMAAVLFVLLLVLASLVAGLQR